MERRPLPESPEHFFPQRIVATLRASGSVFAEEEAQMLIAEAETEADLARMVEKRTSGIPIEQIFGWAEFFGHRVLMSLDGGGDGLDVYRRIAASTSEWLAPGGNILIETSEGQALAATHLFGNYGLGS